MSKYRITLTPVDKFFFGGEMTFQVGDKNDSFNTRYSSYIIQSSRFPQQTSLLGMLRFLILSNAGESVFADNKIKDGDAASALIGSQSFTTNSAHNANTFGKIKSISRVRVLRGDVELEFAPLYGCVDFNPSTNGTYNLGFLKIPQLKQYDAKKGLDILMMPKAEIDAYFNKFEDIGEKPNPTTKLSDIFIEDRRIGISRSISSGKTDDGALFKQISYRFNNKEANHCFVFDAEVDDFDNGDRLTKYSGQLVSVGGDNSQFMIGITACEAPLEEDVDDSLAISLLSPAFLTREEVRSNTIFAITQLMSFCFLTDRKDNRNDDDRSYHILNSKLKRSERYELYAPGTVFYFESNEKRKAFVKALKKNDFCQIGYNEYKTIK